MTRYLFLSLILAWGQTVAAQRLLRTEEALSLALANGRNTKAASLTVQQQRQLLTGAAEFQSPQIFGEASPYEPLILGVQQTFSLPAVYRNRRALQQERLRLAQLQLTGAEYELKRDVRLSYLQLQFLYSRERILKQQDSIYSAIKTASKRFFEAGQINKLEELQAASQADAVRNDLERVRADISAEMQLLGFYTNLSDSIVVEPLGMLSVNPSGDTLLTNVQQQILRQQVAIGQSTLQAERSELLPQVQAGVLFPTTREKERPVGYQVGITIPVWQRQNRSRIAAARTGVEVARAGQDLQQQRLQAEFRQALVQYRREGQSLAYYNHTALPQARAIMETSQRLFQGGELNYIESLRNLQAAFAIFLDHAETHRAYNEAVIQLNYLNGTL